MISLISVGMIVFYLYSAFYIYMLNHRSYTNYVFWLMNINFAVSSFANFMLINAVDYHKAYVWMKIYRYSILPVPCLLFLGVLLLAFPQLNKKKEQLTIIFGLLIGSLWVLETTSIGDQSFYLFQALDGFRWQIKMDTLLSMSFNLIFILSFVPSIILSFLSLGKFLKDLTQRYSIGITVLSCSLIVISLIGMFRYFVIAKDGLYNGIFYFIAFGMPISLIYFFVFQNRKLPLVMLDSYSVEIINTLNEGVLLLDENFEVQRSNSFAKKLFGWTEDGGYAFADYQKDCLDKMNKMKYAREKLLMNQEGTIVNVFGKEIPVSFTLTRLSGSKKENKYLLLLMDVSKLKEMEEQLTDANRELNEQIIWRTNVIYDKNNALLKEMDKKEEKRHRIEHFLEYDYVTELLNKNGFMNEVSFSRVVNEQALISINLLNIKMISENFSRMIVEKVIIKIADFLKENWDKRVIIARFENYRFLLYCEKQEYKEIADQILQKFLRPLSVDGFKIELDCGIGIVYENQNRKDINQMIIESDLAANQARKYGKNQYYIYHEDMDTMRSAEFSMLNDYLYAALTANELKLRYGLKFDAKGTIVGLIADIYWQLNENREIVEKEIIEIAEMYNYTQELERWRINQIIEDMRKMSRCKKGESLPITIRLMKTTLYNEDNINELMQILEDSHMDMQRFEFSLGEDIFMQGAAFVNACLAMVRSYNIKVGLRNFGGLYSSLKYLRDLEIDFIVLAPEFVEGIGINSRDEAILKMILDLAKNMNYSILVENVVRKKQLDFLIKDCHEFAGLYFSKPMSIDEICNCIEKRLDITGELEYNI
ncbi:EAL domain-containing protein [Clostridiales bacterium COT073_COT-073]|nr:EAL domain-containing protein [Clostridiales bacterium COT073_COT-073]